MAGHFFFIQLLVERARLVELFFSLAQRRGELIDLSVGFLRMIKRSAFDLLRKIDGQPMLHHRFAVFKRNWCEVLWLLRSEQTSGTANDRQNEQVGTHTL